MSFNVHRKRGPKPRQPSVIRIPPTRLGICAVCAACDVPVTRQMFEQDGPFDVCGPCATEPAVYRDDFRGYASPDEEIMDGGFRYRVAEAHNRIVPAKLRGVRRWLNPTQLGGEKP